MTDSLLLAAATRGEAIGEFLIRALYIVAALMFYLGLKMMSSPKTARRGNMIGALGMLLAVVITLVTIKVGWGIIIAGLVVGGLIGAIAAKRVEMTQMPELVALFNGSGGAASALVAMADYWTKESPGDIATDTALSIGVSVLIGVITLFGSLVAFGKLSGKKIGTIRLGNPLTFSGQHFVNLTMLLAAVGMCAWLTVDPGNQTPLIALIIIATLLGVLLTIPIGGADMPVVVSLLNSYSGIAAAATGFVLNNQGLIVAGSLVGASGLILTQIMCKAMNRSLLNVLAGGFGQDAAGPGGAQGSGDQTVRQMDSEEAAMVLEAAQNVVIVPGYGMAVAQAQHSVAELAGLLKDKGINVKYGIHPVAGRMPGHMNVLLAEANVPYEQLFDLELNGEMEQCDAVLVIGANDVVNPAARDDSTSQIYGMPIFNVDKAKTVMVCKRSLNPGFAGIENQLFFLPNTVMLFGDAKNTIVGINTALKEG